MGIITLGQWHELPHERIRHIPRTMPHTCIRCYNLVSASSVWENLKTVEEGGQLVHWGKEGRGNCTEYTRTKDLGLLPSPLGSFNYAWVYDRNKIQSVRWLCAVGIREPTKITHPIHPADADALFMDTLWFAALVLVVCIQVAVDMLEDIVYSRPRWWSVNVPDRAGRWWGDWESMKERSEWYTPDSSSFNKL